MIYYKHIIAAGVRHHVRFLTSDKALTGSSSWGRVVPAAARCGDDPRGRVAAAGRASCSLLACSCMNKPGQMSNGGFGAPVASHWNADRPLHVQNTHHPPKQQQPKRIKKNFGHQAATSLSPNPRHKVQHCPWHQLALDPLYVRHGDGRLLACCTTPQHQQQGRER